MKSNFNDLTSQSPLHSGEGKNGLPSRGEVSVTMTRQKFFPSCTLGFLHIQTTNLVWRCKTLELPWLDNTPGISCIPKGNYTCRRVKSSKFGETFQVCDVPNRQGILFHAGNSAPKDTRGCILLGVGAEVSGGNAYLLSSRPAMKTFMQMLEGVESFDITIN